jgi:hypothetical protein
MPSGRSELLLSLGALQQIQVLVELWALSKHPSLDSSSSSSNNNNNNNNNNNIMNRGESSSSSSLTPPSSSSSSRYDSLIVVEALKALVRMAILSKSGSRLLLNGGMTNFDPYNMMAGSKRVTAGSIRGKGGSVTRSGLSIQIIKAFESFRGKYVPTTSNDSSGKGDVDNNKNNNNNGDEGLLWWDQPATAPTAITRTETSSKVGRREEELQQQQYRIDEPTPQTTTSLIPPPSSKDQLRRLEAWAQTQQTGASRTVILGELLHILRPVIYTLALKKWGRTSWKPYLLSLFIDLSSWQATAGGAAQSAHAARHAATHPSVKGTSLELLFSLQAMQWRREDLDELTRRKLLLGYYLLRDPMFGRWTVRGLRRWERVVERVPLVGWMTGKGVEILVGAQQLYSYTCAS